MSASSSKSSVDVPFSMGVLSFDKGVPGIPNRIRFPQPEKIECNTSGEYCQIRKYESTQRTSIDTL